MVLQARRVVRSERVWAGVVVTWLDRPRRIGDDSSNVDGIRTTTRLEAISGRWAFWSVYGLSVPSNRSGCGPATRDVGKRSRTVIDVAALGRWTRQGSRRSVASDGVVIEQRKTAESRLGGGLSALRW